MTDFSRARDRMVELQLERRGISDVAVLNAMRVVPREAFLAAELQRYAYDDNPLPIDEEQTVSQPYIVALMIEAAAIGPDSVVLEIGSGCGYAAAVISRMAGMVYGVERFDRLGKAAKTSLEALGYRNIEIRIGDGSDGWQEKAPFDAIIVSAGAPSIPARLRRQLKVGGRMIVPVARGMNGQVLLKVTRRSEDDFEEQVLDHVAFLPLVTGKPSPV